MGAALASTRGGHFARHSQHGVHLFEFGGEVAEHRLRLQRTEAMAPGAVARALRRAALAAMHAADPLAPHRRVPAWPMVVLAARLAARREAQVAAPSGVALRQRCRAGTVYGVGVRFHIFARLPGGGA
jgi:hypothetical protein